MTSLPTNQFDARFLYQTFKSVNEPFNSLSHDILSWAGLVARSVTVQWVMN